MNNSLHLRRKSERNSSGKKKVPYSDVANIAKSKIKCPICSCSFDTQGDFNKHYHKEVTEFLDDIPSKKNKVNHATHTGNTSANYRKACKEKQKNYSTISKRNNSLKSIKRRQYERYSRFYLQPFSDNSATTSNRESGYELIPCSMCDEFLEIENSDNKSVKHLAKCFSTRHTDVGLYSSSEEEDLNEENAEEISWAGQTWLRTSSLLGDALHSQEGNLMRLQMADGDEILDVDGDVQESFGDQQFTESDVIPCDTKDGKSRDLLRQAVCSNSKQTDIDDSLIDTSLKGNDIDCNNIWNECGGDKDQFIGTLQKQVDERLELAKCTICMGSYNQPVVSTNCWHVCCRNCWLRALGAKKLCPKCNQIVSPSHLRKIYL